MQLKISFDKMPDLLGIDEAELPKYTGTIINIANQWSHGTRPKIVGQMSDLIQEFPGKTFEEWKNWYRERHPNAIDRATNRVWNMLEKIKEGLQEVNKATVKDWVEDLVVVRTFLGLRFQEAILAAVARQRNQDYRLAEAGEESKGIDGYIGESPVSIKPETFKSRHRQEDIDCEIIYYRKTETAVVIEFEQ